MCTKWFLEDLLYLPVRSVSVRARTCGTVSKRSDMNKQYVQYYFEGNCWHSLNHISVSNIQCMVCMETLE